MFTQERRGRFGSWSTRWGKSQDAFFDRIGRPMLDRHGDLQQGSYSPPCECTYGEKPLSKHCMGGLPVYLVGSHFFLIHRNVGWIQLSVRTFVRFLNREIDGQYGWSRGSCV